MRVQELTPWDGSVALLLDGGTGPSERPPLHLQAAAGGYLRLVGRDGPVLWGLVDRDYYGVDILRGSSALEVVPPIRADECDIAPESDALGWWTRRLAALLAASSVTPLAPGRRYLLAPIDTISGRKVPPLAVNLLDELLAQQQEFTFDWDFTFMGLLLTRPLADASDGRVKTWRKRAREGKLPPLVTWWCRGLFAHVLLDGHDRVHAALLEGVKPDVIVLADATSQSKQEIGELRESGVRQAASLETIASVAGRAHAMNSLLRAGWDPRAEWELATPGFPLDGGVERWSAEVAGSSLAAAEREGDR